MYIIITLVLLLMLPTLGFPGASFNNLTGGGGAGSGSGAMENESSTVVAPGAAGITWIRVGGGAGAPAIGVDGSGNMVWDADGDLSADCTVSKSGGIVTVDCANTNATIQPGQTNGDIKFNDSAGTECLELDPDTGVLTQGTNCAALVYDNVVVSATSFNDETGASVALSGDSCYGYSSNNDADAITFTLCDVAVAGVIKCFHDNAGGAITIDPNGTDTIDTNSQVAPSAGEAIILASGQDNAVCLASSSATTWRILPGGVGALTEETP